MEKDTKNETILITGVAGFIGSHVCLFLTKKFPTYSIVGVDKISYCSSEKSVKENLKYPNFTFHRADITDVEAMKYIFRTEKVNIVMHFAAYTHVDHSFANSIEFTKNNVLGTHVMLELSKTHNVSKFIHVSTDEVYGGEGELTTENSILAPTNPYSATKAAAEHLAMAYHISFGLNVIITRGNNVYGPRQYPEKVIPKFITHLDNMEMCPIQGNGKQKRSFLYVDDVCSAFEIILHKGLSGEIYNVGSKEEYTILKVFDKLWKFMIDGKLDKTNYINFVKDRGFNDQRYNISSKKLSDLGWTPKIPFDEGLHRTIKWYLENKHYFVND